MKVRLLIVVIACLWGWGSAGWVGVFTALLLLGILGAVFPYRPKPEAVLEAQESFYDRTDTARRGSLADPTRPQPGDDHPLLLTHEIKRRR